MVVIVLSAKACVSADLGPSDMRRGNVGGNEYAPHPVAGVAVIVPTAPALQQ